MQLLAPDQISSLDCGTIYFSLAKSDTEALVKHMAPYSGSTARNEVPIKIPYIHSCHRQIEETVTLTAGKQVLYRFYPL